MSTHLNLVLTSNPISDIDTGDPIFEIKTENLTVLQESAIPNDFFLYYIKLGDKHCNNSCGLAFDNDNGILHNVPLDIINRIKNKTAKILISWPMESFLQDYVLILMHSYFKHKDIELNSVIYLSCCPNSCDIYKNFCLRAGVEIKMNMEYIPWYLYDSRHNRSLPYVSGKRKKHFLCMNRRMHQHRTMLLMRVYKENLLDNFYYSFPNVHPATNETFLFRTTKFHLNMLRDFSITEKDVMAVSSMLPLRLDITNWEPYPLPIKTNQLDRYYTNSLFSIVTETYFNSKIIHLTEKTFKPIINRHPFIMIASSGTLGKIKEFGFKTFDSIIDESYDNIIDDNERFEKIFNLIEEIATWNQKKRVKVSNQIKDIVDYNYELLQNRDTIELNTFVEKYKG